MKLDARIGERIQALIEKGQAVLGTRRSNPPAKRTCCSNGTRRSVMEWLRVVFKRGRYFYRVRRVTSGVFYVSRLPVTRDGEETHKQLEGWLCANGHWAAHTGGAPDVLFYEFYSSRAADEYVRRLNNGIPINFEVWITVGGILIALADVFVVVKLAI